MRACRIPGLARPPSQQLADLFGRPVDAGAVAGFEHRLDGSRQLIGTSVKIAQFAPGRLPGLQISAVALQRRAGR